MLTYGVTDIQNKPSIVTGKLAGKPFPSHDIQSRFSAVFGFNLFEFGFAMGGRFGSIIAQGESSVTAARVFVLFDVWPSKLD